MTLDDSATDLARWREAGQWTTHRGYRVFYQDAGTGDDVLLCVHGFPTASWDWHAVWPALRARFRLLAPDMLGFGFSAKPRGYAYSILDQADLHEALVRGLGVRRVHVLAHDYGDTVAQELLARDLERRRRGDDTLTIASVCLLNGGLFPETHRARLVQRVLAGPLGPWVARLMNERTFRRSLAAVFGPHTQPTDAALRDFWALFAHEDGRAVVHSLLGYMAERRTHRARWVGALTASVAPVRLIAGPEDPVSGAHMIARYRAVVPAPDVVELPGIGHYPQVEDAVGVSRAVLAFHDRSLRAAAG